MADTMINYQNMKDLLGEIARGETEVFAPVVREGTPYIAKISSDTEIAFDFFITANSIKEALFPRYEPILKYKIDKEGISTEDIAPFQPIVIFGGHPCDAASIPIMEKIFGWDYKDRFYLERREKTIIITTACEEFDKNCFCTSLGFSPRGEAGSDILLERNSKSSWKVKAVTERGKEFIQKHEKYFKSSVTPESGYPKITEKDIPTQFDKGVIKKWLEGNFENPAWKSLTANCWSCSACTFVCPTCHCFDMTDNATMWEGIRTKNWDACTMPIFTLHTSQHNPREAYYQRYRQRISHKYTYYVDLFGVVSCTGCGRCSRVCGAGINISEILTKIENLAKAGGK